MPDELKGEFLTILRVEDYNGGRSWLLLEPLVYRTSTGEEVMAPACGKEVKGTDFFWTWNGASIPRFFWRIMGSPFVGRHRRPSVLHDWLWTQAREHAKFEEPLLQSTFTYRFANWVFWDAMIACREPRWSAYLKWLATAFWASFQKGGWL